MTETTEIELQKLISKLELNPLDLDLMNKVAIGYLENPQMEIDGDELKYFKKAYEIKKTVKSTHNLAYQLYFEWGEEDRAFRIQSECISMKPKSYYPYYQYGFMLLEKGEYEKAIKYFEIAISKANEKIRNIEHNLGCCHFKLGNYDLAKNYFTNSAKINDIEYMSLFNLALSEYKLDNLKEVRKIADLLYKSIESKHHKMVDGYNIGALYFLLNDFKKSSDSAVKQGIDGIDLLDWKDLSYSIYLTNKKLFKKELSLSIDRRTEWINEIKAKDESWSHFTAIEIKEKLNEIRGELETRKNIYKEFVKKPVLNLDKELLIEYCGCMMFDCKLHGNREND